MPEYRRFIAYFYEYIDGKKQKNAGFAKVELRNGMWRILFRLTTQSNPEPPQQVYGFVREQGWLLGFLMGTMQSDHSAMEEWAYHADTPVWKEKYRFSDLCGIWIQSGDGRCYVTVWDDEPIQTNRFVMELPKKREPEYSEAKSSESKEMEERGNPEEAVAVAEPGEPQQELVETAAVKEPQQELVETAEVKEPQQELVETAGPDEPQQELAETAEEEAAVAAEPGAAREEGAVITELDVLRENGAVIAEPDVSRKEAAEVKKTCVVKKAAASMEEPEAQEKTMAELFQMRQHFEPFEDSEFSNCVQLMPCDLLRLQQAGWQVGRSSFLQHGFYLYHHLLFGRTGDGSYVLGVPGIPNGQERYMAQMFGFGAFKTAKWRDRGRQFGYWYRILPSQQRTDESKDTATAKEAAR